jgi:hypothetical protein
MANCIAPAEEQVAVVLDHDPRQFALEPATLVQEGERVFEAPWWVVLRI